MNYISTYSCSGEACDDSQVGAARTLRLCLQPRSCRRSRSQEERAGVISTRGYRPVGDSGSGGGGGEGTTDIKLKPK